MAQLSDLLQNNQRWAAEMVSYQPEFFSKLQAQQNPKYLWIGCSDSRVPANQIVGLLPGQMFVHRNVANVVVHTDLNCLSVIQYAIDVLKVEHIIVCGHYGCGGVQAAFQDAKLGLITNWLRHVQDVARENKADLGQLENDQKRLDRLCELNVMAQVEHVCQASVVQAAWERGQSLDVHGWIYGLRDGLIHDLKVSVDGRR